MTVASVCYSQCKNSNKENTGAHFINSVATMVCLCGLGQLLIRLTTNTVYFFRHGVVRKSNYFDENSNLRLRDFLMTITASVVLILTIFSFTYTTTLT